MSFVWNAPHEHFSKLIVGERTLGCSYRKMYQIGIYLLKSFSERVDLENFRIELEVLFDVEFLREKIFFLEPSLVPTLKCVIV